MVKTRSQKAAGDSGNGGKHEMNMEESGPKQQIQTKVELLSNLVQEGRIVVKSAKVKVSHANDNEKEKIFGFFPSSYVEPSTGLRTQHRKDERQGIKGEVNHVVTGLRPGGSMIKSLGRGGGGKKLSPMTIKEEVGKHLANKNVEGKFFGVNHSTTDEEICQWPIQALVQILFQIDESTFNIENANLMKCNPKLLRRLVIEMRNDLRKAQKLFTVESTVKKSTGVFSIETKLWEFEAYDKEELQMILGRYIEIEDLQEEYKQMEQLEREDVRKILMRIQDYMLDAEIQPFHLYVQFQYYKGSLSDGINLFVTNTNDDNESLCSSGSEDSDISDVAMEVKKETLTNDEDSSGCDQNIEQDKNSIKSEHSTDTEDEHDENTKPEKRPKYCHMLSKFTNDVVISRWSAKVLLQVILERAKKHEMFLPFPLLKMCNPKILRRIVRDIRDDLEDENSTTVYKSKVDVAHGMFSCKTAKWEIHSYDDEDLKSIYSGYVKLSSGTHVSRKIIDRDSLVRKLLKIRKKMKQNAASSIQINVPLDCYEGNVEKAMAKLSYQHSTPKHNDELMLSHQTSDDRIFMWGPNILKQFVHIWNVKGKLSLKTGELEKLSAAVLRRLVMQVRDSMDKQDHTHELHVEAPHWATVHSESQPWEIASFNWNEQKELLGKIADKVGKSYEIDDMTQKETQSCIMDMISSKEFKKGSHTIVSKFKPAPEVTQKMLNEIFLHRQQPKKTISVLSKKTSRVEICKWSSKVLVDFLIQHNPKMPLPERYTLIRKKSGYLRGEVLKILQQIQEKQSDTEYVSKDLRTGFYGALTYDWEIQGYSDEDMQDIVKQTREYPMVSVTESVDAQPVNVISELKRFRDSIREKNDRIFFNLVSSLRRTPKRENDVLSTSISGHVAHNNIKKKTRVDIEPYSTYQKKDQIQLYEKLYDDVQVGQSIEVTDCVPSISREVGDILLGSWPPKTRIEILQQAGVAFEGQDCMELLHSLKALRNTMGPNKTIRALTPYYGFFGRNTKDSRLWSLQEDDAKQVYITYCSRYGVRINLRFLEGISKNEVLEELKLIRALWNSQLVYRFDLCVQILQSRDSLMEKKDVQRLYTQIIRRTRTADTDRKPQFGVKQIHQEEKKQLNLRKEFEHIMGLTADWEIKNLGTEEAKDELVYQLQLMEKEPVPQAELSQMSRDSLISKLVEIRNTHTRIYNALNLSAKDKQMQSNLVPDSETDSTDEDLSKVQDANMVDHETAINSKEHILDNDVSDTQQMEVVVVEPKLHKDCTMDNVEDTTQEINEITQCEDENIGREEPDFAVGDVMQVTSTKNSAITRNKKGSPDSDIPGVPPDKEASSSGLVKANQVTNTVQEKEDQDQAMPDIQLSSNSDETSPVKETPFCYLRAKIDVNSRTANVPVLLKQFVEVLREHDSSMQILPFDISSPLNVDTIIVHEDQFPQNEVNLKDWVRGIKVNRNQKLCFSLRITTRKSFRTLKNDIFSILDSKGWWVNFDHVRAETVYLLGWLKGILPRCHSRNLVKEFIEEHIPHLKYKFHVYYRTMWTEDENGESVGTEALAVEGAFDNRNQVFEEISKLHWNVKYGDVIMVPMRKSKECTKEHQLSAYGQQNTSIKNTHSKSIQLKDNGALEYRNSIPFFFADWILSKKVNNVRFLQKAEAYPNKRVKIIYHKDFEDIVTEVLANLYSNVADDYSTAIATRVLGPAFKYEKRLASYNIQSKHAKNCALAIEKSNVKETVVVPKQRAQLRYGASSYPNAGPSYADAVTSQAPVKHEIMQKSKLENQELKSQIKELQAMVSQQGIEEQNITEKLQEKFQKELQVIKIGLEQKMKEDKVETMEAIVKSEKRIEKKMEVKEGELSSQMNAISAMIWETKEANATQSSNIERIEQSQSVILDAIKALRPVSSQPTTQKPVKPPSAVEQGSCRGAIK